MKIAAFSLAWVFSFSAPAWAQLPKIEAPHRLLVVAPHPDDAFHAAGLIQRTLALGGKVKVLGITLGDGNNRFALKLLEDQAYHRDVRPSVNYGYYREQEDFTALAKLGVEPSNVVHLGFPDGGLAAILTAPDAEHAYRSSNTGCSATPYVTSPAYSKPYTHRELLALIQNTIVDFGPDLIVAPHPNDQHPDHAATYFLIQDALQNLTIERQPEILSFMSFGTANEPVGLNFRKTLKPRSPVPTPTQWFELKLTPNEINTKVSMIRTYTSQLAGEYPTVTDTRRYGTHSYLFSLVAQNEIYGKADAAALKQDQKLAASERKRELAKRLLAALVNAWDCAFGSCGKRP